MGTRITFEKAAAKLSAAGYRPRRYDHHAAVEYGCLSVCVGSRADALAVGRLIGMAPTMCAYQPLTATWPMLGWIDLGEDPRAAFERGWRHYGAGASNHEYPHEASHAFRDGYDAAFAGDMSGTYYRDGATAAADGYTPRTR
jgi:hypothetical protein